MPHLHGEMGLATSSMTVILSNRASCKQQNGCNNRPCPYRLNHITLGMQGIPLSLAGGRKIMERMDWGDVADFVTFGNVNASTIDDATYYVLVTPQNVVGNTIMTPLLEMVIPLFPNRRAKLLFSPKRRALPRFMPEEGCRLNCALQVRALAMQL